jgi:arylformamidase
MSEHTGTHIDAPFHFDPQGLTMDQVPVETLLGGATVKATLRRLRERHA